MKQKFKMASPQVECEAYATPQLVTVYFDYDGVVFDLGLSEDIVERVNKDETCIAKLFSDLDASGLLGGVGIPPVFDPAKVKIVENCEGSKMHKNNKKEIIWSDEMIRLLIAARVSLDADYDKPKPKYEFWANVADVLKLSGYNVPGADCDRKWRNLLVTYRKNKEKEKNGEPPGSWKYFEAMDKGIGQRFCSEPKPCSVSLIPPIAAENAGSHVDAAVSNCSSISISPLRSPAVTTSDAADSQGEGGLPSPPQLKNQNSCKARFRKKSKDQTPPWFKRYMDMMEERRKEDRRRAELDSARWKEMADLERQKIACLTELLNVFKKQNASS